MKRQTLLFHHPIYISRYIAQPYWGVERETEYMKATSRFINKCSNNFKYKFKLTPPLVTAKPEDVPHLHHAAVLGPIQERDFALHVSAFIGTLQRGPGLPAGRLLL